MVTLDIPFLEKYRLAYDNIQERFTKIMDSELTALQEERDNKSDEDQARIKRAVEINDFFLASLSRQLLIATNIS